MEYSNVNSDYAGHTIDAVNNIANDAAEELGSFLKNGGVVGSAQHVELSNRVASCFDVACAGGC